MDESRKQRDEFEKWWEDEGWDKKLSNVQGVMFNRIKTGMLTAWTASRAAIEIELPKPSSMLNRLNFNSTYHSVNAFKAEDVEHAIRAAGIKVKE